jgi:hypothetical protein
MGSFVKDSDCGIWERLAALLALELVGLYVVLVLVLFREEVFVRFELLSAMFAHRDLKIMANLVI